MDKYINKTDIVKLINDSMLDLSDSDDLNVMLTEVDELPTITIGHIADDSKKVSISCGPENGLIDRRQAIDAINSHFGFNIEEEYGSAVQEVINGLPSAQPEQRYTEDELRVFQHGISLRLLSKRSAQHWRYDEDTATEIKFLERLYEKVVADTRGEQDGKST